jgi:2-enoate reductase
MGDPDLAVDALKAGKLDAVGLGRPLLADPDYVHKLRTGRFAEVRPCLSCHDGCFGRFLEGKRGSCAVNPECARELITGIQPAAVQKKVVVVGGGVAGMEAARVSALRGHDVTLFEEGDSLGGVVIAGSAPDFKRDDRDLITWYEKQLTKLLVNIKMNTKASRELVTAMHPDAVFVATGSNPILPELPGIHHSSVSDACSVLLGNAALGGKCVIVGGGLVGCELALHLAKQGKTVTIVEALDDILKVGIPLPAMNEFMLRDLLAFHHVAIKASAKLVAVNDSGAVVKIAEAEETLPADNVIIACGFHSENRLFEELRYDVGEIYNIGDSRQVRNIRGAVWDAYEVARVI